MVSELVAESLPALIHRQAARYGPKVFARFLVPGGQYEELSFAALDEGMCGAAEVLRGNDVTAGTPVPVILDTGPEFLLYFFGAMSMGAIPVALPVPFTAQMSGATRAQLRRIGASVVVTQFEELAGEASGARWIVPVRPGAGAPTALPKIDADDVAMMQYSSGTTGASKGILLTHRNLLTQLRFLGDAVAMKADDTGAFWLPLYHDMGIIGAVMTPLCHGFTSNLMSPFTFVRNPRFWLEAITKYRATITAAPNSAFEMCNRKVRGAEITGLDLSSMRTVFCGAELIREHTLHRFAERFASVGFRARAFLPVYGLAEATLDVTLPEPGAELIVDRVKAGTFAPGQRTIPSDQGTHYVSVGKASPGHEVVIKDADGSDLDDGIVGYVWIRGPSVMRGYYNDPEATAAVLQNGWLKTKDLAYVRNGQLFICGRDSDGIIKAGRNLSAIELEDACRQVLPDATRVAAFGAYEEETGTEAIVLMLETDVTDAAERDRLQLRIRSAVMKEVGVEVDHIWLVPRRTVPRTTSGKVQRRRCLEMWSSRDRT